MSKTQLTQVGRALKQLGIEHIPAYSPEAEAAASAFRTLQDRLPKELALAGITTVEAANRFLREVYLPEHNPAFAVARPRSRPRPSSWSPRRSGATSSAIQEDRRVGNDNCVAWQGRSLQIPPTPLRPHLVRATVRVHDYPDGTSPSSKARGAWPASRRPHLRSPKTWPRDHRDAASPVELVDNAPRCPQPHRAHNSGQLMRYLLRTKQRARYSQIYANTNTIRAVSN